MMRSAASGAALPTDAVLPDSSRMQTSTSCAFGDEGFFPPVRSSIEGWRLRMPPNGTKASPPPMQSVQRPSPLVWGRSCEPFWPT